MLQEQFGFSPEVGTLVISLFVAGYCIGPLVFGPLSETIGRKSVFVFTFIIYTGFQVGSALAQNTAQVLVFRFLGGTFASAPLANSGSVSACFGRVTETQANYDFQGCYLGHVGCRRSRQSACLLHYCSLRWAHARASLQWVHDERRYLLALDILVVGLLLGCPAHPYHFYFPRNIRVRDKPPLRSMHF